MSDDSNFIGSDDHDAAHRCACVGQFSRLEPYLRHLARKLAMKSGCRDPEVIDRAFSKVNDALHLGKFNPEKGRLAAWATTVAKNFLRDEFRRRQREAKKLQRFAERAAQRRADSAEDRGDPLLELMAEVEFSGQDLAEIGDWPLERRVEILVMLGLHAQVPEDRWNAWIRELNYPSPFPTDAMRAAVDRHQRTAEFARCKTLATPHGRPAVDRHQHTAEFAVAVGRSKNSLVQNFKRWHMLIIRLRCFWRIAAQKVAPWSEERVAQIAQWTPEQRIVLLALTGCWLRLGGIETWGAWREALNIDRELELFVIGRKSNWEERLDCLRRELKKKQRGRPKLDPAPTWRDSLDRRTELQPFPFPCRSDNPSAAQSKEVTP